MALQPQSIGAAAFNDNEAGGNNYFAGKPIYIYKANGSYANIYSDSGGSNPIPQNGINNVTGDNGVFTFYIDGGEYYAQSDGERVGFWVTNSELIESYAIRAEDAALKASSDAKIFDTVAIGVAGTVDGDYFSVISSDDDGYLDLYKNSVGSAVFQKQYPSSERVLSTEDAQKEIIYQSYKADRFTEGGFIDKSNGSFSQSVGWVSTELLPVEFSKGYTVDARTTGNAAHAWYDEGGVFISSFGESQSGVTDFTAPANASFFKLSNLLSTQPNPSAISVITGFNIEKLKSTLEQHNPILKAESITYDGEQLNEIIEEIKTEQSLQNNNIANLYDEFDLSTDDKNPIFIDLSEFTKSFSTVAPEETLSVSSRDSDNQFTLNSGDGSKISPNGSLVVFDGSNYKSFSVKSISGDSVIVNETLPATVTSIETMHQGVEGQHLSRYGYNGLAEFVCDKVAKYGYRKSTIAFDYNPMEYGSDGGVNITNEDGTEVLIPVETIGSAGNGGFVAGTSDLIKRCRQSPLTSVGTETASKSLLKYYHLADGIAGNGFKISVDTGSKNGFINLQVGLAARAYNSGTLKTGGAATITATDQNSAVVYTKTLTNIGVEFIEFDYGKDVSNLTFSFTLDNSEPTVLILSGLYAYPKSPKSNTNTVFKSGDIIGFLGDSWTQYPTAKSGETPPLRPDGSTGDGMQFISERIKSYMSEKGSNVTTLNMGRGGQTSAWGLHWVNSIVNLNPKPTHCVVIFGINDLNSIDEYDGNLDSLYDFDPNDQWAQLNKSAGGVFGSTNTELWLSNMQNISNRLTASGIKPIILNLGHTGSESQSQNLLKYYTSSLVNGFN